MIYEDFLLASSGTNSLLNVATLRNEMNCHSLTCIVWNVIRLLAPFPHGGPVAVHDTRMQEITALRRAEQRISFSYGLTYAVPSVSIFSMLAHSLHRAVAVRSSIVQGPDMALWVLIWGPWGCTLRSNCIIMLAWAPVGEWGEETDDISLVALLSLWVCDNPEAWAKSSASWQIIWSRMAVPVHFLQWFWHCALNFFSQASAQMSNSELADYCTGIRNASDWTREVV